MPPTKIAYLINQYPAISHTFIRREILALEAEGLTISRISIRAVGPSLDEADEAERRVTRAVLSVGATRLVAHVVRTVATRPLEFLKALCIAIRLGLKSERGWLIHLIYLAEACVLKQWLAADGIEHVHAHFGTNSAVVAMLCRVLGGPRFSFTVHGPLEFDTPKSLSLREKIRHAAFVVAISDFCRSQLYRWADSADWKKIHIVRCVVDDVFLSRTRARLEDVSRLICVGRLVEQKGQLLLIEAAARLRDEGLLFELVFVGDGPMRVEIEGLINRLDLQSRVRIVGSMSGAEVKHEILSSRAMVLPSFAEGLPVVLMEALALGRPVVSTYVAGIPELVQPGVNGWLIPAGSIDSLTAALRDVLVTPIEELEQMGRAGAARVAEYHNATTEASKLACLITG